MDEEIAALKRQAEELREDIGRLDEQVEQAEKLAESLRNFNKQQSAQQAAAARHFHKTESARQAQAVKELRAADQQLVAGFSQLQETAVKLRSASGSRALTLASEVGTFVRTEEELLQKVQASIEPASELHPGIQVL